MRWYLSMLALACLGSMFGRSSCLAKEEKVALDKVPRAVVAAVEKRFPDAKVTGAGREEDEGKTVFEVQLNDKAQHVDVSVSPDGMIKEIEKQITEKDLPKAVRRVLAEKYGKSQLKLAEEVILVTDGRESLDCYEVKMAADGKVTEVKIAADGTVKHEEADEGDEK